MFNPDQSVPIIQTKAHHASAAQTTLLRSAALVAMLAALALPVPVSAASETAQPTLVACRVNGQLVVPVMTSGKGTAWVFVTNLDQPLSKTTVRGCMAVRTSSGTTYTPDNYCTVMNNTANRQFGNGVAEFDGNAYLQCTIPNPVEPAPQFWMHARANFSTTPNGTTFTMLNSAPMSFTVDTDAACLLKLNSRYNNMLFAHATVNQCGSFVEVHSNLIQSLSPPRGSHRIGLNNFYGPTNLQGTFGLPANLSFTIGAVGQVYSLDWLVIDPPGNCCNPN